MFSAREKPELLRHLLRLAGQLEHLRRDGLLLVCAEQLDDRDRPFARRQALEAHRAGIHHVQNDDAEVGISTSQLHAFGPMRELTAQRPLPARVTPFTMTPGAAVGAR